MTLQITNNKSFLKFIDKLTQNYCIINNNKSLLKSIDKLTEADSTNNKNVFVFFENQWLLTVFVSLERINDCLCPERELSGIDTSHYVCSSISHLWLTFVRLVPKAIIFYLSVSLVLERKKMDGEIGLSLIIKTRLFCFKCVLSNKKTKYTCGIL